MKIHPRIISSLCLAVLTFTLVIGIIPTVQSKTVFTQTISAVTASNTPEVLLEQGRLLYAEDKFTAAAGVWQRAVHAYARQQDSLGEAWSLSYLSFAQQALGQWQSAEKTIFRSLRLLERSQPEPAIEAQVLNIQGHLQNSTGKTEAAIQSWQQAEAAYERDRDLQGVLGSKINQAQALRRLGRYQRAEDILRNLEQALQEQSDSPFKVKSLQSLGVALQATGKLTESQKILEQSLAIAKKLNPAFNTSEILFNLGNISQARSNLSESLAYYQLAAQNSPQLRTKLNNELNLLRLYIQLQKPQKAIALLPQVEANLALLSASRTSIYTAVNFAESLEQLASLVLKQNRNNNNNYLAIATKTLNTARHQAQTLQDIYAQALVLTQLGQLLVPQQLDKAMQLESKALKLAQEINAPEIVARAAWKLGQVYQQQKNIDQATKSYELAFDSLQVLRSDLTTINADAQFSFTQTIEPIYRQLVSLLLTPKQPQAQIAEAQLKKARQVIEALQLAQLDNFFREACLKTQSVTLEEIDPQAAVIYPIILADRLEVIVSIPGKPLKHYTTYKKQAELESVFQKMRQSLNPAYSPVERLKLYQQAYSWLIKPASPQLESAEIRTLVFVLDGSLRNLPMAALYDGKQYLLEKYSTVTSPGLQLLQPQNLVTQNIQAIAAGLSEANQGYQALPGVEQELLEIDNQINSRILLNQDFTQNNLQNTIEDRSFSVLHLASHGNFSSNAEETFVLTWNGKINVKDFDTLIRSRGTDESKRIELLVLSACQTAKGDPQATLGLAGLAVRSGASSTLGTLWAVRDRSTTELMKEFYQYLGQPGITRAEALRQAQLSLLNGEYSEPVYWAPFVLVGNWT